MKRLHRSLAVGAVALLAAACSTDTPVGMDSGLEIQTMTSMDSHPLGVTLCKSWLDGDPVPATPFNFTVAVDGGSTSVNVVAGQCVELGSFVSTSEMTITENLAPGFELEAIWRVSRSAVDGNGSPVTEIITELATPSTTFTVADYSKVFFKNATGDLPRQTIGDFVWSDLDGDGIQDPGEPGIPGVEVRLLQDGITLLTTTTDADGRYLFSVMGMGGCYEVAVDTPAGTTPSPIGAATTANDSNRSPAAICLPGTNFEDLTIDFGFVPVAPRQTIGDFVWSDLDGDGIQDPGEPGIPGVEVRLVQGGTTLLTTTTDADGRYLFSDMGAGCYTVVVATPAGTTPSPTGAGTTANDSNGSPATICVPPTDFEDLTIDFGFVPEAPGICPAGLVGGLDLGGLTDNLFFFSNGSSDANWQSSSKGYVGNVVINGVVARERTSGTFAYAGTIFTNDGTLGGWQRIVDNNAGQATSSTGEAALVSELTADLDNAFAQINALPVTPGFEAVSSKDLDGLNFQNGISERIVINVTSDLKVDRQLRIRGDAGDVFFIRWDQDANSANGYQGQVKFQSGGAIVPQGGLTAGNFVHVAGDLNASGGGSTPPLPFPQGPRLDQGQGALINGAQDFSGGGFFTGYWFTTGKPSNGETSSMSNAIFVGGWYSTTTKFSMTSGTSGVHVCPAVGS
jgi:hypothetical protein